MHPHNSSPRLLDGLRLLLLRILVMQASKLAAARRAGAAAGARRSAPGAVQNGTSSTQHARMSTNLTSLSLKPSGGTNHWGYRHPSENGPNFDKPPADYVAPGARLSDPAPQVAGPEHHFASYHTHGARVLEFTRANTLNQLDTEFIAALNDRLRRVRIVLAANSMSFLQAIFAVKK